MALARAFTKRPKRQHLDIDPREARFASGSIDRAQISLPTELISTTNVHALTAPDIRSISVSSSNSSLRSGQDSDFSRGYPGTPSSLTEPSSTDSSPVTPEITLNFNNYFDSIPKRSATTAGVRTPSGNSELTTPALPQRALSHSKKAHQDLARKRSQSRMTPPPIAMASTIVRRSIDIFSGGAGDPDHPFGRELAQVNEVAEGFSLSAMLDEESQILQIKGLLKFEVEDYINEICGMYGGVYENQLGPMANPWI